MGAAIFIPIADSFAITYSNGIYRQLPLYRRHNEIYAKFGGGFIRLSLGGITSHTTRYVDLITPNKELITHDSLGRLSLAGDSHALS